VECKILQVLDHFLDETGATNGSLVGNLSDNSTLSQCESTTALSAGDLVLSFADPSVSHTHCDSSPELQTYPSSSTWSVWQVAEYTPWPVDHVQPSSVQNPDACEATISAPTPPPVDSSCTDSASAGECDFFVYHHDACNSGYFETATFIPQTQCCACGGGSGGSSSGSCPFYTSDGYVWPKNAVSEFALSSYRYDPVTHNPSVVPFNMSEVAQLVEFGSYGKMALMKDGTIAGEAMNWAADRFDLGGRTVKSLVSGGHRPKCIQFTNLDWKCIYDMYSSADACLDTIENAMTGLDTHQISVNAGQSVCVVHGDNRDLRCAGCGSVYFQYLNDLTETGPFEYAFLGTEDIFAKKADGTYIVSGLDVSATAANEVPTNLGTIKNYVYHNTNGVHCVAHDGPNAAGADVPNMVEKNGNGVKCWAAANKAPGEFPDSVKNNQEQAKWLLQPKDGYICALYENETICWQVYSGLEATTDYHAGLANGIFFSETQCAAPTIFGR